MTGNLNFAALALFAFVSSITPGPNNLLLMRAGARFGFRPIAPHVLGIGTGMAGLVLLSWIGVGALLLTVPAAFALLRWACFAYLLWLAWRVLRDPGDDAAHDGQEKPMNFASAAAFQLVNPKAWMMAVTGVTAFSNTGEVGVGAMGVVVATFLVIGWPCFCVWALWGAAFHRLLRRPAARRVFNVAMAVVVAVTAFSMLITP